MAKPNVLILHASGTNRDHEAAQAVTLAGGAPEIVHINALRSNVKKLSHYQMMIIPGGFSYGDALGAGRRLALDLQLDLSDDLAAFVAAKKPILGICNGFQALVKSGLLPPPAPKTTLTHNHSNHFECRWVTLIPHSANTTCIFTQGIAEPIFCPAAHGEGRFEASETLPEAQIALHYADADGMPTENYPHNPNGSPRGIAAISNSEGFIMGLMPHPEDHIFPYQHPQWTRGVARQMGLVLFEKGVAYAAGLGA